MLQDTDIGQGESRYPFRFQNGLVWLSVSMYSVVLQHLPSVCLKPTSKNDQVTVDYLNDLIGDIGVMSIDKK